MFNIELWKWLIPLILGGGAGATILGLARIPFERRKSKVDGLTAMATTAITLSTGYSDQATFLDGRLDRANTEIEKLENKLRNANEVIEELQRKVRVLTHQIEELGGTVSL